MTVIKRLPQQWLDANTGWIAHGGVSRKAAVRQCAAVDRHVLQAGNAARERRPAGPGASTSA